ncbi:MAG: helix-turn-helix transcriptional regulator [Actinomycetia bacterium]|nr:helix-turn-helix transcriptional regulator [Actinomycetes bacterium]
MTNDALVPSLPVLLILRALEAGPAHGYKIARWIEEQSEQQFVLKEGTLYPTLHLLERQGLVQGSWIDNGSRRRMKVYELTSLGRSQLDAERDRWLKRVAVAQKVLSREAWAR